MLAVHMGCKELDMSERRTELNCIVKTLSTNLMESFSYSYLGKMGYIGVQLR